MYPNSVHMFTFISTQCLRIWPDTCIQFLKKSKYILTYKFAYIFVHMFCSCFFKTFSYTKALALSHKRKCQHFQSWFFTSDMYLQIYLHPLFCTSHYTYLTDLSFSKTTISLLPSICLHVCKHEWWHSKVTCNQFSVAHLCLWYNH
jgi:hypothetical protein